MVNAAVSAVANAAVSEARGPEAAAARWRRRPRWWRVGGRGGGGPAEAVAVVGGGGGGGRRRRRRRRWRWRTVVGGRTADLAAASKAAGRRSGKLGL